MKRSIRRLAVLVTALAAATATPAVVGATSATDTATADTVTADTATDSSPATSEPSDSTAPSDTTASTASEASLPDLTGETLTLYSGRNEELVQPIIDRFVEETGADVEVRYGSSAEVGAAILEEGDRAPADVFFSQEVGAVGALAKADMLTPLPDEVIERVDPRFAPAEGNLWVGVTARSRVIVYNPDLVETPPAGVLELTEPQYRGMTAWVPGNAGFQAFITGFRVSRGDEAVREWIEGMKANEVQAYESNGDVLEAVNNGDLAIGLINHYYWARMADEVGGADRMTAQLIFPAGDDPGGLVNATAAAILQRGADNPAALAFVEFLVSDEGQQYFVDTTSEYPVVEGIADPVGVPPLADLEGPQLDLTDLDSLVETQTLLTEEGLLS